MLANAVSLRQKQAEKVAIRGPPTALDKHNWPDLTVGDIGELPPPEGDPTPEAHRPKEVWQGYNRHFANEYFKRWGHWSTKGDSQGGDGGPDGPNPLQPWNVKPEKKPGDFAHTPGDYPDP